MIRVVAVAAFFAVMIPLGWAIKGFLGGLDGYWDHFADGVLFGFLAVAALWIWDDARKRRQRSIPERRGD